MKHTGTLKKKIKIPLYRWHSTLQMKHANILKKKMKHAGTLKKKNETYRHSQEKNKNSLI